MVVTNRCKKYDEKKNELAAYAMTTKRRTRERTRTCADTAAMIKLQLPSKTMVRRRQCAYANKTHSFLASDYLMNEFSRVSVKGSFHALVFNKDQASLFVRQVNNCNERQLLHGLDGLEKKRGRGRVDNVTVQSLGSFVYAHFKKHYIERYTVAILGHMARWGCS